ncbi:MAG TPA: glycerate-2-kinase family protein, partial [bacterium]|nr:glycerate-2-kinase family protein [bacterium]
MTALRFDPALFRVPETAALRRAAAKILAEAVRAVDPYAATARALVPGNSGIRIDGRTYRLRRGAKVVVVGAGKAAPSMARAAERALGRRITAGLVTTTRGYRDGPSRITVREASHPVPDAGGEVAAREMLALVRGLSPDDLVLCLLSGGGSALLPLPRDRLPLEALAETTSLLLRSGADIVELNTVRKHLSAIAGGQLARAAAPARVATLAISDVVGSRPDAVASGPTVPDPTTFADALAVLDRYGVTARIPG